jgi:hypothetical protein
MASQKQNEVPRRTAVVGRPLSAGIHLSPETQEQSRLIQNRRIIELAPSATKNKLE